jgi:hypothetical protein
VEGRKEEETNWFRSLGLQVSNSQYGHGDHRGESIDEHAEKLAAGTSSQFSMTPIVVAKIGARIPKATKSNSHANPEKKTQIFKKTKTEPNSGQHKKSSWCSSVVRISKM